MQEAEKVQPGSTGDIVDDSQSDDQGVVARLIH